MSLRAQVLQNSRKFVPYANFSIVPAGSSRPQEYVINVRLISKIAMIKELQDEVPKFIRKLGIINAPFTVEVTVDYVDYVIARGFLEAIDEWIKGCKSNKKSNALKFLQKTSHHIPMVINTLVPGLLMYFAYHAILNSKEGIENLTIFAKLLTIFLGGAYITIFLIKIFAENLEMYIDNVIGISYIKLNRGDDQLIEEAKKSVKKSWVRIVVNILATISVAIIASKLEKLI